MNKESEHLSSDEEYYSCNSELDDGLRVATWNVNSIRSSESELYSLIETEQLDVIMLQETRVKNLNLVKKLGQINTLKAKPKKHKKGGYLSGGQATIALNRLVLKLDYNNTSEHILVSDLLLEDRPGPELKMNYLKLINVYC